MAETTLNKNQAGVGIWTQDTLKAGNDISIVQKTNPYVIDSHTLACFHFNNNAKDEVSGDSCYVASGFTIYYNDLSNKYKFGGYSLKADRGGSYSGLRVYLPHDFTLTEFTIDYWTYGRDYFTLFSSDMEGLTTQGNITAGTGLVLGTNKVQYKTRSGDSDILINSSAPLPDSSTMHHYAVCRDSNGMMYYYRDGSFIAKGDSSAKFSSINIASMWNAYAYNIDELRISDVCRWGAEYESTGFTVPTEEYATSSTSDWYEINNTKQDELPSQTGNSGKFLTTNGTTPSWAAVSSGGGVTESQAAHAAMPSDVYETFTATNNTIYTAPSDGYFYIGVQATSSGAWLCCWVDITSQASDAKQIYTIPSTSSGSAASIFLAVRKNEKIMFNSEKFSFSTADSTGLKFIYCEGTKDEYTPS